MALKECANCDEEFEPKSIFDDLCEDCKEALEDEDIDDEDEDEDV